MRPRGPACGVELSGGSEAARLAGARARDIAASFPLPLPSISPPCHLESSLALPAPRLVVCRMAMPSGESSCMQRTARMF